MVTAGLIGVHVDVRVAAVAAAVAAAAVGLKWSALRKWKTKRKVLLSLLPVSRLSLSLPQRPFLSRALPARPLWLLATLFDGLLPSAGAVRC